MGWASFAASLAIRALKGSRKAKKVGELGIAKPRMWDWKERGQYQGVKALHKLGYNEWTKGGYDMQEAIRNLPEKDRVSAWWLEKAISTTHKSANIRTIMAYVKSAGASNLSPQEKAHIWMMCLDKMKYLGVLRGFFE